MGTTIAVKGSKASSKEHMIKIFRKAGYTEQEIIDYYKHRELKAKKDEQKRTSPERGFGKSYKN